MEEKWEAHRTAFDSVAELYDEVRPGYPDQLVIDALAPFDSPSSIRILEIGCGTGQATKLFAEHDCEILAVEPGSSLIEIAARNLKEKSKVSFENCRFEDWELQPEGFDLVIAAVSIYWIDPEVRYRKIAGALKTDGYFASIWNGEKVSDPELQSAFDQVHASVFDSSHPLYPKRKPPGDPHYFGNQILESGLFSEPNIIEYPQWTDTRSKEHFIKLLQTKSGYSILPEEKKNKLYQGIGSVIDQNGGEVEMNNTATLYLARKLS